MAYNVKFLKGTAAAYQALTPDANTFYYTTDDNQFYLGSIKLSNANDVTAAVSRIGANETAIAALQTAVNTLNADNTTPGSVAKQIKDAVDALNNSLADVATSGEAEDVSIADSGSKFTSTNVEDALAELVTMIDAGGSGSVVTVEEKQTPTTGYLKSYDIKQGNVVKGTIDIPKDLVVTSGQVVVNPDGQPAGTYIKLTIANQTNPIYINVADLVDAYTPAAGATQVQLAISNTNEISATIVAGSIGSTELATNAVVTAKITDGNVTKAKLAQAVQDSLDLADSAVQSVTEGNTNGTVNVDGTDVAVHGLDSAAYQPTTAFDAAGAADAVLGTSSDDATQATVYGAKAAASAAQGTADQAVLDAAAAQADVDALEALVGSTSVGTQIDNKIAALDAPDTAVAGQYVSAVSETDGVISVTRVALPDYTNTYDPLGAADDAETAAKAYTDTALTWQSF